MIVFKDAEKHDPKKDGMLLCIWKDTQTHKLHYESFYCKDGVINSELWFKEVIAFSEVDPETALKGISEDPEETVYK